MKLAPHLEELMMHYAGQSGRLEGIISSIETILNVTTEGTDCDSFWALAEIRHLVDRANKITQRPEQ